MWTGLQHSHLQCTFWFGFYIQFFFLFKKKMQNTTPPVSYFEKLKPPAHTSDGVLSEYSIYLRRPHRTKKRCQPHEALDLITPG